MAAVITPARTFAPALIPVDRPLDRPPLRLVLGGRGEQAMAAVYRRRRLLVLLVVVTVLILGAMAARAGAQVAGRWAAPTSAVIDGPTVEATAERGDTLWTLARRVQPTGDVRPAVEAMLAERGTTAVQVGERVRVPAG